MLYSQFPKSRRKDTSNYIVEKGEKNTRSQKDEPRARMLMNRLTKLKCMKM